MASLYSLVSIHEREIRSEYSWVAFWKEGRSWWASPIYVDELGLLSPDSENRLRDIQRKDPKAIVIQGNPYLEQSTSALAVAIRKQYESGQGVLSKFIKTHSGPMDLGELDSIRTSRFFNEGYEDPYVDGSLIGLEDISLQQQLSEKYGYWDEEG